MQIEYDPVVDMAYVSQKDIASGEIAKTVKCVCNLDLDKLGRIIGIEIFDASKCLPAALLAEEEEKP